MKRLIFILLTIILISSLATIANAHSGRTDSNGGHYNHSTGEYHYHHGYPEHQHINGECPYEDEEKEKQEALKKKRKNYYKKEQNRKSTLTKIVGGVFVGGMGGWLISSFICAILSFCFKKHEDLFMGRILVILTLLLSILLFIIVFNII